MHPSEGGSPSRALLGPRGRFNLYCPVECLCAGGHGYPRFSPRLLSFRCLEEGLPKLLRRGIDSAHNVVDRIAEVTLEKPIDSDCHPGNHPGDEDPLQGLNATLILEVTETDPVSTTVSTTHRDVALFASLRKVYGCVKWPASSPYFSNY